MSFTSFRSLHIPFHRRGYSKNANGIGQPTRDRSSHLLTRACPNQREMTLPPSLRRAPIRIPREHARLPHIVQSQIIEHHPLHAKSGAGVRTDPVPKTLHVRLQSVPRLYALLLQYLDYQIGIVTALRSRADLLSSEEDIVRIGELGIVRIGHGVERTYGGRVLVQHEEIGAVFLFDSFAEGEFHGTGQISQPVPHIEPFLRQNLLRLRPVQDARLVRKRHPLARILLPNNTQLIPPPRLQTLKNVLEYAVNHLERLFIMIFDGHLQIQPREFAQVPAGVRIFGPKDRSDFEDAVKIGRDCHLLVQLRTLGQTRSCAEVIGGEDSRPGLRFSRDELGGVYLDKTPRIQGLTEQLTHGRLHPHDGVVRRSSQVHPTMIESEFLTETRKGTVGTLTGFHLLLGSGGVLHQKGENGIGLTDSVDAIDLELGVAHRAGLDIGLRHDTLQIDDGLHGQGLEIFDHLGGTVRIALVLEVARLHRMERILPQYQKARSTLDADRLETAADPHGTSGLVLRLVGGTDGGYLGEIAARAGTGHDTGHVAEFFVGILLRGGEVRDRVDAFGLLPGGFFGRLLGLLLGLLTFLLGLPGLPRRLDGGLLFLRLFLASSSPLLLILLRGGGFCCSLRHESRSGPAERRATGGAHRSRRRGKGSRQGDGAPRSSEEE
mmetsp:Transcript_57173/g.170430  ORF Transcript_57173/g.170430 Transcript_57173/m.170430 type:complete len:663 (+) Transcript_57173:408-2396(+)